MASDDSWNPFDDPQGADALKTIGDRLSANEWTLLIAASAGKQIREVEIDRLVSLGLATRDQKGEPHLTKLGHDTVRSGRREE